MKDKASVICYCTYKVKINCSQEFLKNYNYLGIQNDIQKLSNYQMDSIDYLIIFANKYGINSQTKHMLIYLRHIFKRIVVVSETRINILNDYLFVQSNLAKNNLDTIIRIAQRSNQKHITYSYKRYTTKCMQLLLELGFKKSHKGSLYITEGSYLLADSAKGYKVYQNLYSYLASIYNVTVESIERCIRSAIAYAIKNNSGSQSEVFNNKSNKKFLLAVNNIVVQNYL